MQYRSLFVLPLLAGILALSACGGGSTPAPPAATQLPGSVPAPPSIAPEELRVACQTRAASEFRVQAGAVQASYEGQRVDGTHAVNGSANVRGRNRTFQCSFDRSGTRIVRFVVNR